MQQLMPHGMCFLWNQGLILLHTISDCSIGISYVVIAGVLFLATTGSAQDILAARWPLPLFVSFIFWCAMTHFLAIVVIWWPLYLFEGIIKALTAIFSVATAAYITIIVVRMRMRPAPADDGGAHEPAG